MDHPEKPKAKIGADGLTKYQRYYIRHPEVKIKNRERERLRRQQCKEAKAAESQVNNSAKNAQTLLDTSNQKKSTMPPDFQFLSTACAEHAWVDTLKKLEGDVVFDDPDPDIMVPELDALFQIRKKIMNWSFGWGGVAQWSMAIDYSLGRAIDQDCVEEWRDQVFRHAEVGRRLLHQLAVMDQSLPTEEWKLRQIWNHRVEFMAILIQGLTILDMKTSILPGLCNVENTFDRDTNVVLPSANDQVNDQDNSNNEDDSDTSYKDNNQEDSDEGSSGNEGDSESDNRGAKYTIPYDGVGIDLDWALFWEDPDLLTADAQVASDDGSWDGEVNQDGYYDEGTEGKDENGEDMSTDNE